MYIYMMYICIFMWLLIVATGYKSVNIWDASSGILDVPVTSTATASENVGICLKEKPGLFFTFW